MDERGLQHQFNAKKSQVFLNKTEIFSILLYKFSWFVEKQDIKSFHIRYLWMLTGSPHITSAQYCGGCSVHWRLFSTWEGNISTVGDSFSTVGG